MRVINSYILIVAVLMLATTVIMTALGQPKLENYYTFYVLETLVVTELFVLLSARARRALYLVSLLLFAGFLIILAQKVIAVLA